MSQERTINLPDGYSLALQFGHDGRVWVAVHHTQHGLHQYVEASWFHTAWKLRDLSRGVAKALQVIERHKLAQADFADRCEAATEHAKQLAAIWAELGI